jgi:hypothetical protein
MPWCEDCSQFYEEDDLGQAGDCPGCGTLLTEPKPIPWHFKLLAVITVIYLAYRTYQMVTWLAHHL